LTFRLSPGYNIGNVLFQILGFVSTRAQTLPPLSPDLLQWERCGANIAYLFGTGLVALPLLMLVDHLKNFPAIMNKIVSFAELSPPLL
jgi:hypothetical protein